MRNSINRSVKLQRLCAASRYGLLLQVIASAVSLNAAAVEPVPGAIEYQEKTRTYSLHLNNISLRSVLAELAAKSGVRVDFPADQADFTVSINLHDAPLDKVLPRLIAPRNNIITYEKNPRSEVVYAKIILVPAGGASAGSGAVRLNNDPTEMAAYQNRFPTQAMPVDTAAQTAVDPNDPAQRAVGTPAAPASTDATFTPTTTDNHDPSTSGEH